MRRAGVRANDDLWLLFVVCGRKCGFCSTMSVEDAGPLEKVEK